MTDMKYQIDKSVMDDRYWELWNADVMKKIDHDIETNRKADATFTVDDIEAGSEVKVEQLTHAFFFGSHIFNFNQLGTQERNQKYKDLYGTFFNSATIPFYWKKFEMEEGKPRFQAEYRDTEAFWNTVKEPYKEAHWRRPATDPVVEFCESKGLRLHGHTLVWGNNRWNFPEWLLEKLPKYYHKYVAKRDGNVPDNEIPCHNDGGKIFEDFTPEQIEALVPEFTKELNLKTFNRIIEIAMRYKGRFQSWDVVNESATDFGKGLLKPGSAISKSTYGIMPGDYDYKAFKTAETYLPAEAKLNINDYNLTQAYPDQVKSLQARNCKIDVMGVQMHLFNPADILKIAEGKSTTRSPEETWGYLDTCASTGLPLHLSEITIMAPSDDDRGRKIQAIIARNLYRLWFSYKSINGITWWNVVDNCGAPGEPSYSGLFTRDMEPKDSFKALNDLINHEWKTNLSTQADRNGAIAFRGFRGTYQLSYTDKTGEKRTKQVTVN